MKSKKYHYNPISEFVRRIRSKNIKDVLFRTLFEENKDALLELYNALNNSNYQNPNDIEVVTIKNAIYVTSKNDLAYMLAGVINLYEHQSTINPNMPVRFLTYLAQEYQIIIERSNKSIYHDSLIMLPTPKFVVFYNGDAGLDEMTYLNLSDAYINKNIKPDAELTVQVININANYSEDLKKQCNLLREYSEFVRILKEMKLMYKDIKVAIEETIEYCIHHNILANFLRRNRAQVPGMLLSSFEKEKYDNSVKESGRIEGRTEGLAEGLAKGLAKGLAEGLDRGKASVVVSLYNSGMSVEEISERSGISLDEVKQFIQNP